MAPPERKESRAGRTGTPHRARPAAPRGRGPVVAVVSRERRGSPATSRGATAADLLADLALSPDAPRGEIEAQLDRLIDEAVRFEPSAKLDRAALGPTAEVAIEARVEESRVAQHDTTEDAFDPSYERSARAVLELLYSRYFRVAIAGVERIPARGPCLLVVSCAGSGTRPAPIDGLMLRTAVKLEHSAARDVRWQLLPDGAFSTSVVGTALRRLGAVAMSSEEAAHLLGRGEVCAVFAEHAEAGAILSDARRRGAAVVMATITADEPSALARLAALAVVPVVSKFPALGRLPAPARLRIELR